MPQSRSCSIPCPRIRRAGVDRLGCEGPKRFRKPQRVPRARPAIESAAAAASFDQGVRPRADNCFGVDALGSFRGWQIEQFALSFERAAGELLNEQLAMSSVHGGSDIAVCVRPGREQRQRGHALELAIPGDRQPLRGGYTDANPGEASWTYSDKDFVGPTTSEQLVEHRHQSFAVPAADQLVTMRKAGAVAVEQRGAACRSRSVDGQDHVRFSTHLDASVFTGTGTRQVGKSANQTASTDSTSGT